jgi:hypothetical protein
MQGISLFLFVLSIIFVIKHLIILVIKLITNNLEPIKLNWINETFLYLSISYIITYLIN